MTMLTFIMLMIGPPGWLTLLLIDGMGFNGYAVGACIFAAISLALAWFAIAGHLADRTDGAK
jgi:hypothetical protein